MSCSHCDRPATTRGMCSRHYQRWRRTGNAAGVKPLEGEQWAWFLDSLTRTTDQCVLWPYRTNSDGYAIIWDRTRTTANKDIRLHPIACEHRHGPKPPGLRGVRHLCGVRACVNPEHLVWGSAHEDAQDRRRHGTTGVKLTEDDVRHIRATTIGPGELASQYGVSRQTITNTRARRTWRHVT